jgi:hypothetical protein
MAGSDVMTATQLLDVSTALNLTSVHYELLEAALQKHHRCCCLLLCMLLLRLLPSSTP